MTAEPASAAAGGLRKVRRVLLLLATAFVVHTFVLPQLGGARRSAALLSSIDPRLVVAALAMEVVALAAYAQLTRTLLPDPRLTFRRASGVMLSSFAVSHTVPGGSAAGTALALRLHKQFGISPADAGYLLAVQGVGSAAVLNVLWWAALVVSIPTSGLEYAYLPAALIGAVVVGIALLVGLPLLRGDLRSARALARLAGRLPRVDGARVERALVQVGTRMRALGERPTRLGRAGGWAALNWLADASCLWLFLAAFGTVVRPDRLFVAYGLAYVLAAVPITPAGLGVVEATLTASLVGFGVPRAEVALAVVAYRLINFWLPIPVGAAAYVGLRTGTLRRQRPVRTMLHDALEEAGPAALASSPGPVAGAGGPGPVRDERAGGE